MKSIESGMLSLGTYGAGVYLRALGKILKSSVTAVRHPIEISTHHFPIQVSGNTATSAPFGSLFSTKLELARPIDMVT
jgi:hypothetical protein